ncbi:MAG: hypothetical protein WCE82_10555 [Halobacteriota archaeon]
MLIILVAAMPLTATSALAANEAQLTSHVSGQLTLPFYRILFSLRHAAWGHDLQRMRLTLLLRIVAGQWSSNGNISPSPVSNDHHAPDRFD